MTDYTELKRLADAAKNWGGEVGEDRWYTSDCFKQPYFSVPDAEFIAACDPGSVRALIAENERIKARLYVCRDCGGQGEIYSGHSSYQGHNQPPEPDMDVCGTCGGDGVLGPLEDFESLAAERDQLKAENEALNSAIEDLERSHLAGFDEYDFTRLKDRRGDQKVFEITIETECGCDVEESEYTVRITHLLGSWLGSDDFGLISDAVAEVVADLVLPEEGHTTFIAYESGEQQDVFWTKWYEIATVASVLAEPNAVLGKGASHG